MSFSGMEERVPEAWELVNDPVDQRQKRKARLRLVRRGALATTCLLIGVCVFSVLAPGPVSIANSLFGRAQSGVSGVFYPNDASGMPPPPPSDFVNREVEITSQIADCKTIKEVHETYGMTVYEPTQIPEGMELCEVQANISDGDLIDFSYRYEADEGNKVIINIAPVYGEGEISYPENSFIHTSPVGEFHISKSLSDWKYATALTKESYVTVSGTLSKDDFLKMLDTLRPVN